MKDMHAVVISHDIEEEIVAAVDKHFSDFIEQIQKTLYNLPVTKDMVKRSEATGFKGFLDAQLIMLTGQKIAARATSFMAVTHADFAEKTLLFISRLANDDQD